MFDVGGDFDHDGFVAVLEDGSYIFVEVILYNIGSAYGEKKNYYLLESIKELKSYAGTAYVRRKITEEKYKEIIQLK